MVKELFFTLWFFLPAAMANMMPILVAKVAGKTYDAPIDGGRSFRGKRIFGDHKTWRGLISGMVASTLTLWLQQLGVEHSHTLAQWTNQVYYPDIATFIVGPLFGFGVLAGDAIESFFKRQRSVAPGHSWFPFDQIDYVIGCIIAVSPFIHLHFWQYVVLLVFGLIGSLVSSYIGFLTGFKERPI